MISQLSACRWMSTILRQVSRRPSLLPLHKTRRSERRGTNSKPIVRRRSHRAHHQSNTLHNLRKLLPGCLIHQKDRKKALQGKCVPERKKRHQHTGRRKVYPLKSTADSDPRVSCGKPLHEDHTGLLLTQSPPTGLHRPKVAAAPVLQSLRGTAILTVAPAS